MIRSKSLATLLLGVLSSPSWAAAPSVVVDIAPLHSIVSEVMNGVGQPQLLVQAEASPHSYSLRPSEAEALVEADVVFWISEDLTPWLPNSLNNLAGSSSTVKMLELSATETHGFREGATFEAHAHHDDDHQDENHQADEHHEEDHHGDGHHGEHDPHAWLDPVNAKAWATEIATELSRVDPANADLYQKNAGEFGQSMDDLMASLEQRANRLDGINFIVFHDAYQYFERRFGLLAAGAISVSDASDPSPARIREIQAMVKDLNVTCAFTEPQYNPSLVKTVFEGSEVETVGVMDPLGVGIPVGRGLYSELLESLMTSLEQCRS